MAKQPNDPTRHTPPAGKKATEEEDKDREGRRSAGDNQLEGGKEADVINQPGRGNKSGHDK